MNEDIIQAPEFKKNKDTILNEFKNGEYSVSLERLKEETYKVKNTDVQYRTINHWTQIGILSQGRSDEDRSWRSFSLIDLFWSSIVVKLRSFGMPLKPILLCKECLFTEIISGFTWLDFACLHCARIEGDILYLVVFDDGESVLLTRADIELNEEAQKSLFESYITINMNLMFLRMIPKAPKGAFQRFSDIKATLNEPETQVIKALREDEVM